MILVLSSFFFLGGNLYNKFILARSLYYLFFSVSLIAAGLGRNQNFAKIRILDKNASNRSCSS